MTIAHLYDLAGVIVGVELVMVRALVKGENGASVVGIGAIPGGERSIYTARPRRAIRKTR